MGIEDMAEWGRGHGRLEQWDMAVEIRWIFQIGAGVVADWAKEWVLGRMRQRDLADLGGVTAGRRMARQRNGSTGREEGVEVKNGN